jgi:hypothetical protein
MTSDIYNTLITEFCKIVGLADAQKLEATGSPDIDGFQVALAPRPLGELLDMRVELTPVPADRERDVYRMLLEMNAATSRSGTGQIGIDTDSGHAIFNVSMPLNATTRGEDLARTLDHVVNQAQYIRDAVLNVSS